MLVKKKKKKTFLLSINQLGHLSVTHTQKNWLILWMRWSTSFSSFKIRNGKGSGLGWVRAGFFHTQTRNPNPAHLLNGFFSRGPNSPQRASLNPAKFGPIHGPNSGPTKKKKKLKIFLSFSWMFWVTKHYNPE